VIFEWDALEAAANLKKHGTSFDDAASVFLDPLAVTFPDPDHSAEELREITVGHTMRKQLLLVSHCDRRGRIRIVSARRATHTERRQYEEGIRENA
jgi:hypothetical protein